MKKDEITVERAIEEINNMRKYNYTLAPLQVFDMAISALKSNEWIPVTERLPEKNMACLVAVGQFNLTQMAMYSDLMGTKNHRIFYQGDFCDNSFEDITEYVKAWQPLPEPYKKGE